ncbi:MAG TPA: SMC-Scp complex subunit ScpB [Candidatus Acidoferrum sp.]|nr:SMC-Scp complex subunit ScpB [Candidatus Acidoferrum sp.]
MRKKRKLRARSAGEAEQAGPDDLEPDADAEAGSDDTDTDLDLDPGSESGSASGSGSESDVESGSGSDVDAELAEDPDAELTPAFVLDPARLRSILESLLFASEKPLTLLELRRLIGFDDAAAIQAALETLMEEYRDRGLVLYDVAGGFQFRTHPQNSEYVQRLIAGRPVRLSRAQLETLAIIAYRQPVTRPEIDEIRGVDSGSTLKVLLDRSLIRVLGKKEEPGRPLLYGTSKEFLEFFNLSQLRDLPTLREFHELTEESMREVEALEQAAQAREGGEPEADAPDDGSHARGAAGDDGEDDDSGDEDSTSAPH